MKLKRTGRFAAFVLVTGLFCSAFAVGSAFAESPHVTATVDTASCAACHRTHTGSDSLLLQRPSGTDTQSGSCLVCHNGGADDASNIASGSVDSFGLASGHSLISSGPGDAHINGCSTCHDVHGSSSETRMIPAKKINGVTVTSAGKKLCLACHDSSTDWYGAGYPSTSKPTRDATGFPVAGTWPGSDTYESSSNGHRLIPETTRTVDQSAPVRREKGDCLYCHAAHGGANAYDGLVTTFTVPTSATLASDQADGSYAALCFTCHGGDKPDGFDTTPVDIKRFATASAVGTSTPGGHSIVTSGGTLPVGSPLPCFECHNPHGSKRGNSASITDELGASLSTTSDAGVRAFCFTCHTTSDKTSGWDSDTATLTTAVSSDKVVGIPRDGGVLHLSDRDGHRADDTTSCYECHGSSYTAGGYNVHNPASGETGFAPAIISATDTSTVASATLDASSSVPATGSVDASGSVSATTTPDVAVPVSLLTSDTLPPMTVSDALTSYVGTATITLSAVDNAGGLGVAETWWVLDGGALSTGTVTTSVVGTHTLTFWSVDLAGNIETPTSVDFTVTADQAMADARFFAVRRGRVLADTSA